jgi:phosphoglycerol transferase MdoB-like AlkP superfamily enzyme
MFFVAYFQPVRSAITKKILAAPIAFSSGILAISLYLIVGTGSDMALFEMALGTIYPIFDAIIIIPALVGVALFFKGKVNLMWTLFCFGIILLFAADAAFLFLQNDNSYYTGNPMEIMYFWNYILLSFGIYNHLTLFQKSKANKFEDLR